jgi:hypothetical protein
MKTMLLSIAAGCVLAALVAVFVLTPINTSGLCIPVNFPHANTGADQIIYSGYPFKTHTLINGCDGPFLSRPELIRDAFKSPQFFLNWLFWSLMLVVMLFVTQKFMRQGNAHIRN